MFQRHYIRIFLNLKEMNIKVQEAFKTANRNN